MKTCTANKHLSHHLLTLGFACASLCSYNFAQAAQVQAQPKTQSQLVQVAKKPDAKAPKQLLILDKSWQMRSASFMKKMAYVEQLQKDLDEQFHTNENQSRILVAQSVVLVSEEQSQWAAVGLLRRAAQLSPLKLNKQATTIIWKDIQKKFDSQETSNYNILADIAAALATAGHSNIDDAWNFFLGIHAKNAGKTKAAAEAFEKIEPNSSFYRHAKLLEGLLSVNLGQQEKAKNALETVLALDVTTAEKKSKASRQLIVTLKEHAVLNLARLLFEQKEFKDSLSLYRSIDSSSPLFYESLSEQGWAFFLAGHPNRALGVGYGVTSPFFNKQFQPDQYFLNAAVNYWLCDFSAARQNIQSFVWHTKEDAALLRKWEIPENSSPQFIQKQTEKAYQVASNIIHGVSASNNLIGPRITQTIARKSNLIKNLKHLENLRTHRLSLQQSSWPMRSKNALVRAMIAMEESEQNQIGELTLSMINAMRIDYERALTQLRLIHVEIMTAEKDKLMNKERSATGQQFLGTEEDFLQSEQQALHVWSNERREFWKDELDSFVFKKTSQCQTNEGKGERHAEK